MPILDIQEELARIMGTVKEAPPEVLKDPQLAEAFKRVAAEEMKRVVTTPEKLLRRDRKKALKQRVVEELSADFPERQKEIEALLEELEKETMRRMLVTERQRIDGRRFDEIRPITIEVGVLPRTHGSAMFRRGETQVLAVVTWVPPPMNKRLRRLPAKPSNLSCSITTFPLLGG